MNKVKIIEIRMKKENEGIVNREISFKNILLL